MALSLREKQNIAIKRALAHTDMLPIQDGRMSLFTKVRYCTNSPEDGQQWSDTPAGDPWGRAIIEVLASVGGKDVEIDAYRVRDADDDVSPVHAAPPIWWRE